MGGKKRRFLHKNDSGLEKRGRHPVDKFWPLGKKVAGGVGVGEGPPGEVARPWQRMREAGLQRKTRNRGSRVKGGSLGPKRANT